MSEPEAEDLTPFDEAELESSNAMNAPRVTELPQSEIEAVEAARDASAVEVPDAN